MTIDTGSTSRTRKRWRTIVALAVSSWSLCAGLTGADDLELTIASYNIRYGTAEDGPNHWTLRREDLTTLLRQLDADVVGLQEALDFQIEEILDGLPRYAAVGVGRDDGKATGEQVPVLFDRERFRVAEAGSFWFSDTPTVPGSSTWGNEIPRIATWARLIERSGHDFWVFNVHLDHLSQPSRERSAELLARAIAEQAGDDPVLVTGDLNAGEDNPAIATLIGQRDGAQGADGAPLYDTFRALHADSAEVATFSSFQTSLTRGPKIDYVLATPAVETLEASIVRWGRDGRAPSDHYPVVARVRLPADVARP